jgi:hypothetical protein
VQIHKWTRPAPHRIDYDGDYDNDNDNDPESGSDGYHIIAPCTSLVFDSDFDGKSSNT